MTARARDDRAISAFARNHVKTKELLVQEGHVARALQLNFASYARRMETREERRARLNRERQRRFHARRKGLLPPYVAPPPRDDARKPIGPKLRFAILQRDGFRCRYCGTPAATAELQVDHVVPVAKGGTNDPANLVTACWLCNIGKSDASLAEAP